MKCDDCGSHAKRESAGGIEWYTCVDCPWYEVID